MSATGATKTSNSPTGTTSSAPTDASKQIRKRCIPPMRSGSREPLGPDLANEVRSCNLTRVFAASDRTRWMPMWTSPRWLRVWTPLVFAAGSLPACCLLGLVRSCLISTGFQLHDFLRVTGRRPFGTDLPAGDALLLARTQWIRLGRQFR